MAKPFMNCNFKNCGAALTKFAWITRCSHVFCDEHGEMFFHKAGAQVRCPACNEVKNRETDLIRNDLNPTDLLISTVRPGKALDFALHACRLWSHQMEYRRRCNTDQVVRKYEGLTLESTVQLQSENKELKNYVQSIEKKLKQTNDELFKIRARLNRYKTAYHACRAFPGTNSNNSAYEQRIQEDRLHSTG
ncbi:hypothetical protein GE061_013711 [Apolygus lucorum]|uniref:RING-type domain-containing protein n=1 Tax=Apolygus lucorum TaxID=248454 RepID=A0A8S9XSM0_APOLU|nr:hypothetical protein GE061_013711 [Apolygus lucorum]